MIETKEKLFASNSAGSIISKELADDLYKLTKNTKLKALMQKEKIIIPASLRSDLKAEYDLEMNRKANASANRKGVGGRKRLPDLTEEELEKLSSDEKLKYQNRIWQRNSRARRRLALAEN